MDGISDNDTERQQVRTLLTSNVSLSDLDSKRFKSLLPQILAALLAASFNIVYGMSMAYSAIVIPAIVQESNNGTNPDVFSLYESQKPWIASVIVIVVPLGSLSGGVMMDALGRLTLVRLSVIPNTLGWMIIALAQSFPVIIIGRILTGIGAAWSSGPAIVYITEIARTDMRGSLISVSPAYASLGMVLTYLLGWIIHWRTVAWVSVALSVIPFFALMFIPESPLWLVSKGKDVKAKKSLEWINRYQNLSNNQPNIYTDTQLFLIKKEQEKKKQQAQINSVRDKIKLLFLPTCYKPMLILIGLFFFQQFSGTYITLFYAVTFFEEVGTDINPYLASIFLGLIRFIMSIVNTYLMKRYPRRTLMLFGVLGMSSCMAISGLVTIMIQKGTTNISWIPVLMLVIYVMTSMVGLLSIPWTIIAELFPLAIRGVAHGMVYSFANLIMFGAIQSFYEINAFFGGSSGLQFFFAVVALAGLVYSYILLPETHGKKLSEIEEYFENNTIYLTAKKSTKTPKKRKEINANGDVELVEKMIKA